MSKSQESLSTFGRPTILMFFAVLCLAASGFVAQATNAQGSRVVRALNNATAAGVESQVEMRILLDALGDESSTSFTVNFNPFVVTNLVVTRGSDVSAESNLQINTTNLGQGQLGILIYSPTAFAAGTRNIVNIRFTVPAANAVAGTFPFGFGSVPTPQNVLNSTGQTLPTTYEQGYLSIGTADGVGVSGRIVTPDGQGIRNVVVTITDRFGNRRFATTSSFGYYFVPYVRLGENYTFTVQSKRYRFAPRVIPIIFPLPDLDFVGLQ